LTQKMALFAGTARICHDKRDLFSDPSWIQVMLGQNLMPRGYNPMAANMSNEQLRNFLSEIKGSVMQAASRMPTHDKFLADHCAADLGTAKAPVREAALAG
jgi:tryptophan 7-halogenase